MDIGSGETDTWVEQVATAFIQGYSAGHSSGTTIAVGTANDDYSWSCNNSGTVSSNWSSAGSAWGDVLNNIGSSPATGIMAASGNDIESWYGDFSGGWVACGVGAEDWLSAFQTAESVDAAVPNVNYGSDGNAEDSSQWTKQQVYNVSNGSSTYYEAEAMPEIYCSGQPSEWAAINNVGSMVFWGATSENGASFTGCNGNTANTTYTWQESWNELNNAVSGTVDSAVDIYP